MKGYANIFKNGVLTSMAFVLAAVFASSAMMAQPGQQGAGQQGANRFAMDARAEARSYNFTETGEDLSYCIYKSSKVSHDKPAPLIIALHGMGAPASIMCNATAIDLAEAGGYIYAAPMGYNTTGWFGSPVIQMRAPGGAEQAPALAPETLRAYSEKDVMNVLGMMKKEFNVDEKRIYLTGHSMGGAGTYYLGSAHTDIWAAIAPVAPAAFMMTDTRADILQKIANAKIPVMVVHGTTDEVVPVDISHTWTATMKELGMKYEFVELPDSTHGPVITDSQKAIFDFFARQSK